MIKFDSFADSNIYFKLDVSICKDGDKETIAGWMTAYEKKSDREVGDTVWEKENHDGHLSFHVCRIDVHKQYRGTGIGREMLTSFGKIARRIGLESSAELSTKDSQRLWSKIFVTTKDARYEPERGTAFGVIRCDRDLQIVKSRAIQRKESKMQEALSR